MEPQLLYHRVPGSDSLAKYAVAFFKISRSIFTRANSRFVSYSSLSSELISFLALADLSQLPFLVRLTPIPDGLFRQL